MTLCILNTYDRKELSNNNIELKKIIMVKNYLDNKNWPTDGSRSSFNKGIPAWGWNFKLMHEVTQLAKNREDWWKPKASDR
jgi:hypothetical protein